MKSHRGRAGTKRSNTHSGRLRLMASVCMLGMQIAATIQAAAPDQQHATPAPLEIASKLQLFVDRELIGALRGLELRLHAPVQQPLPKSPLKGDYLTVIKQGDTYRAYYRGDDPSYAGRRYSGHPGEITCYAESRDGHEWTFPRLGLFEVNGTRENNVILAGQPPFSHNFSPFLDPRPDVAPSERFKALAGHPGYQRKIKAGGLWAFVSADGVRWRKRDDGPAIPYDPSWSHAFDSQNVSFWSEAEGQYVCYFRTWAPYRGNLLPIPRAQSPENPARNLEAVHGGDLRTISRTTSPDFRRWSAPVAMNPNLPGEHLYTNQTHPYFRAPHIYIALPTRYIAGRIGAEKADPMLGSTDILFMTSRAGSTVFDRLFPEAFLRPGLDPQRWESRGNYVALNVAPTGGAEMSIYHSRSGHRYTLRTDGFVSVRAGAAEGELTTKPLRFAGRELVLNVSTSAAGSVRVEIQDADGAPVAGFANRAPLSIYKGRGYRRRRRQAGAAAVCHEGGRSVFVPASREEVEVRAAPRVCPDRSASSCIVIVDTQGTRGVAGRHWRERIWTTVATCAQQHRSTFRFFHDTVLAYLARGAAPLLLPQVPRKVMDLSPSLFSLPDTTPRLVTQSGHQFVCLAVRPLSRK